VEDLILAHWYTRFDTFSFSTQEFYERLSAELHRRQMPDVSLDRISLAEGGLLSAQRDYYRIRRGDLTFTLCAAPFGIDFFVSWWLLETPGCIAGCITMILPILAFFTRRTTFYKEDSAIIFREAVHQAVLNTIDGIFKDRHQTFEGDRKPVTRSRLLG
jgi:hypothetical protein